MLTEAMRKDLDKHDKVLNSDSIYEKEVENDLCLSSWKPINGLFGKVPMYVFFFLCKDIQIFKIWW